jgi:WD40 repeat protein
MPQPSVSPLATRSFAARLFGYDVFVSFALGGEQRGTRAYASDLARRLRELDFTVFFSEQEAPAGAELEGTLLTALRRSRTLVVIANRGTLREPRWVRQEVEVFRRDCPGRPVVPISIDGALQDETIAAEEKAWLGHSGHIWIDESAQAADAGASSDSVVHRLVTAPSAVRSATRLRWMIGATIVTLAASAGVAAWQAVRAEREAATAIREARAARAAVSSQLSAHSRIALPDAPPRSLLLAVAALKVTGSMSEPRVPAAEEALRDALATAGGTVLARPAKAPAAVELSADGHWLAVATKTGAGARLWNLRERDGPSIDIAPATAIAFSADSRWLAAATPDGQSAKLWALGPPASVAARPLAKAAPPLAFSADARWLVSGGADEAVRLWSLSAEGSQAPQLLPVLPNRRVELVLSPDSRWLVVGSWSERDELGAPMGRALLCDLHAPSPAAACPELSAGRASLNRFVFDPGGRWLAAASSERVSRPWRLDPDVRVFDLRQPGSPPRLLVGHTGQVGALVASDDGKRLASGASEGSVLVWNMADDDTVPPLVRLPPLDQDIAALAFGPRQEKLLVVTGGRLDNVNRGDPTATLWNLAALTQETISPTGPTAGEPEQRLRPLTLVDRGRPVAVSSHRFDDLQPRVLLAGGSGLYVLDLAAYDPMGEARVLRGHEGAVTSMALSHFALASAGGASDRSVRLWDLALVQSIASPQHLRGEFQEDGLSDDSRWLVTRNGLPGPGNNDKAATLWDLSLPTVRAHRLGGHRAAIHAAAISPGARWVATASHDGQARLWKLGPDGPAATPILLKGHEDTVQALAFSADGRTLATGSSDRSVRLWDLTRDDPASGSRQLAAEDTVFKIEFVGAHWLVASGVQQAVRVWDLRASNVAASVRDLNGFIGFNRVGDEGRWLRVHRIEPRTRESSVLDLAAEPWRVRIRGNRSEDLLIGPAGRWVLGRGGKEAARLWALDRTSSSSREPIVLPHPVEGAVFTAGDSALLTAAPDGSLRRWDLQAPDIVASVKEIAAPTGQEDDHSQPLALSPDQRLLFVGGRTPRLMSLDGPNAGTTVSLPSRFGSMSGARFTRDGRWLLGSGASYTTLAWQVPLEDLERLACATAGRALDDAERRTFAIDSNRVGYCETRR